MHQKNKKQTIPSTDLIYTDSNILEILKDHEMVEKKFLGTLIMYPDSIGKIFKIVEKEDFHVKEYREIYEQMLEKYSSNQKIDIITLTPTARVSTLADLMLQAGIESELKETAELVKSNSNIRTIFNASFYAIQGIGNKKDPKKIFSIIQEAVEKTEAILPEQNHELKKILVEFEAEQSKIKERKIVGFPTWPFLDQLVYGLIVPHIWIIGGSTGTGKTFFTLQLVERILRNNASVVFFSTENSRMRNALRLLGCCTGIHEMRILKGELNSQEEEDLKQAKEFLAEKTLYIFDNIFQTNEIKLKLKLLNKIKKIDIVVIDYIQQLNENEDGYEQMRKVSLDLQRIAKEMNCAIIGVSQISNEGQKNKSMLRMTFKGAGEIAAIADVAMEITRSEKERNWLGLLVKKVRHNISGTVEFRIF